MTRDYDKNTTHHDDTTRRYDSNQIAKITQNQANSERGFVLATPVDHHNMKLPSSKKTQKSSKIKPLSNEVLSSPRLSTITKKHKYQAQSSQVRTRFCLRHARHPRHPNSKKCEKSSKVKPSLNEVFALRYT